jgi:hypothetical protein
MEKADFFVPEDRPRQKSGDVRKINEEVFRI